MPDGKLNLRVMNVFGQPVGENVDVLLKNRVLSHAPMFRNLDVSSPRDLKDLHVSPNGDYRIEVDALSYHAVSRFISIPANGQGSLVLTLPIDPKKVMRVEFPDYKDAAISDDAWKLLERSRNIINFAGLSGEALYSALDPIRKAGFLNLVAKSARTVFPSLDGARKSVLSFIEEIRELRGDRFFASVPAELRSAAAAAVPEDLFKPASNALHTPPKGFTRDKSFKTLDSFGNLQLSFFKGPGDELAMDMDIDDAGGFEHVFQVIGNIFSGGTHPYNIHQILIASQELDPRYRLVIHEG